MEPEGSLPFNTSLLLVPILSQFNTVNALQFHFSAILISSSYYEPDQSGPCPKSHFSKVLCIIVLNSVGI